MKIGVISNLFPPEVCGGYEIGCGQVVEGLRGRGLDVQVLTSACCPKEDRDYVWNTLSCSVGVGFSKMSRAAKLRYIFRHERTNLRAFQSFLQAVQPDILYFWNLSQTSRSMLSLARQSGIPYGTFVFDHGLCGVSTDPWLSQFQKVSGNLARRVQRGIMACMAWLISRPSDKKLAFDFIHYPTEYLRELLVEAGIESKTWCRVSWGVDTELFHSAGALPQGKLLYVGQVSPHKGVHLAIEAMGMLKAKHPDLSCQLTIAGRRASAGYESELKELVARYDLKDNLSFTGFVAREDLPELYRKHAILLFPSIWEEPMGISVLEALASGLAVISSGTGGSGELFEDGVTGRFFKSGNATDLSVKIEELATREDQVRSIGHRARDFAVAKYRFSETMESIIKNISK
jgi:glycosyltransferase involved in cell wall biosynthesis